MRIFSTLILFVFFAFVADAQGNMQFNQVIRVKYPNGPSNSSNFVNAGTITVPVGKVWKIESGSIRPNNSEDQAVELYVDDQLLFYRLGARYDFSNPNNLISPYVFNSPPIWLSSGNYVVSFRQGDSSTTSRMITISALEFNIVP